MNRLIKMIVVEAKLHMRDVGTWVMAVLLPTFILGVLGAIPGFRTPDEAFGGARFIDLFVPSLMVMTLGVLGVNALPLRLTSYREKGVLRRLSTTPAHPAVLLAVQLMINLVMALMAAVLLITVGNLAFQIALPQHLPGFLATFFLGMSSLFALGLMIAAVAPTSQTANLVVWPLFFVVMFLGGVYVPRFFLPEIVIHIGQYTPPGVQAILDAWTGTPPQPLQLMVLALMTLVAGALAARLFRWE
jgi:ABC-2 type transport system permease protein